MSGWSAPSAHRRRRCRRNSLPAAVRASRPSPADVSLISNRLVSESKRFKWGAKRLNLLDAWKRWFPCAVAALIVLGVLGWYIYMR